MNIMGAIKPSMAAAVAAPKKQMGGFQSMLKPQPAPVAQTEAPAMSVAGPLAQFRQRVGAQQAPQLGGWGQKFGGMMGAFRR